MYENIRAAICTRVQLLVVKLCQYCYGYENKICGKGRHSRECLCFNGYYTEKQTFSPLLASHMKISIAKHVAPVLPSIFIPKSTPELCLHKIEEEEGEN